jgi:exoribonuclease-2
VKYAKKLLREIKKRTEDEEIAADNICAFNLCVKAGIFKESENLAIHRYNIISSFKEEELKEAENLRSKNPEGKREDFTNLFTFTIDDETTRDFDDALSLEVTSTGYNLYVHIADAANYIEIGSPLDKRASNLGMSVYMPSGTVSMFPKILSEEIMSLKKGEEKYCLTFLTKFDADLNIISKQIFESVIKVCENLSFEEASKRLLENDEIFSALNKIANKLFNDRLKNNAIEFVNPDIKVLVEGDDIKIRRRSALNPSSVIVKELMILTGYQAASYCLVNNIPCIYITQDEPTERVNLETRIIDDRVVLYNIVKKMKRSNLMVSPFKHYALGLECYTQCTSPIRRYHDLIIQRQLKASLRGQEPPYSREQIIEVSATSESYKKNLGAAQKEEKNYWILRYIENNKDKSYNAIVLAENRGDHKIYIEDFDIVNKAFSHKKFKPSDKIQVKVKNVVPRASILSFKL